MENAEKLEMKRQLGIVFSKLENIDFDVSTILLGQLCTFVALTTTLQRNFYMTNFSLNVLLFNTNSFAPRCH